MKRLLVPAALALAALGPAHAADIKPGLWEFKSAMSMPGMPDMSAQMARMQEEMKKMPPEARKMMEQQMAAQGVAMGSGGEEIKAAADYVTTGVDEDGLYNAFAQLGLI